ncbi:MAG TPA: LacI family DNA-binding transcriptional regulator [Ktedonobacterales bacterium]|jgi:LacI family transcriptional regulator
MADIRRVAELASVSLGTVSNVLNRPHLVSEQTRRRVEQAIAETGFVRNGSARQLRAGHSPLIGLMVQDVANPFFTEVARGVEDAANAAGSIVVLCNSDDSVTKEQRYLQALEEQRVQGILITPVSGETSVQRMRRHGMTVVFLDHPSRSPDLCSVAVDDVLGGDLAAMHLFAQGHHRIGFIHGPATIRQIAERQRGVLRAVKRFGLDPQTALLNITVSGQNTLEGEASVEALLASEPLPAAVFCANDLLALGLMRGLSKQGIHVPQDIAVVGYDDVDFANVLSPPLTTIRQPKYELGYKAAQLLLEETQHPEHHTHDQVLFRPELLVRESSLFQRSS